MSSRILVVEDNASMLQGICDALALAGYEIQPAHNGVEALACMDEKHFDLILSDIMMPAMDGYELFEQVRRNPAWTTIPFIFLTAKDQKADVRLGKQLGADDYLVKPFEVEDLLIAVQSKLERAQALQRTTSAELARLKQNILNTLSHEFRTPLTYISGYTELLQAGEFDTEELKQLLGYIRKGSDRLRRLVEDFLLVVAFETGEAQMAFTLEHNVCDDLVVHIGRLLDTLEPQAAARMVELRRELPDCLPTVKCHSRYLLDAIGRLVDNGIKFSRREGGVVTVHAWADDDTVYIAVSDEGIGISFDQQALLFERFSQINREQMEQQGSGIGLFIAKNIIAMHKGHIDVNSIPGQGSTFTLRLPRHVEPT